MIGKSSIGFHFEAMESRRLYTVVTITGTAGSDTVTTAISGTYLQVTFNGTTTNYSGVTGIAVSGGGGQDSIDTTACTRNATVSGGAGDDYIYTGDGADQITGGDGNDTIVSYAGNDTVNGNAGNDMIQGEDGADYLYGGTGADSVVDSDYGDAFGDSYVDHLFANDSAGTNDGAYDDLHSGSNPEPSDIVKFDGTPVS